MNFANKRIISFILSLSLTLSLSAVSFADETDITEGAETAAAEENIEASESDTAEESTQEGDAEIEEIVIPTVEKKYQDAANVLAELGILQGDISGQFLLENQITRAEFSVLLTKIMGLSAIASDMARVDFDDVDDTHWAYVDIGVLGALKIVNGFSDGTFQPDENVTAEQAIKLLVCAVGYDGVAKLKGGYPHGYLAAAAECGITRNVDFSDQEYLSRAKAALLVYNALFTEFMSTDNSTDKFSVSSGKTLLYNMLGLIKDTGVVTGTDVTRISSSNAVGEDSVEINGEVFDIGASDVKKYLGHNIEFFYRDDDYRTIVYVRDKNTRIVKIKSDDVVDVENRHISYYDGSKRKSVNISDMADYIFNGRADLGFDPASPEALHYDYELVDNNNDSEYDVVFVYDYVDYLVGRVDSKENKIYDKNDVTRQVDLDPDKTTFDIYFDGSKIDLKEIRQSDALSVAFSKDRKYACIEVSRSRVAGVVSAFSEGKVVVDGQEYEFSKYYPQDDKLELGNTGTLFLNIDGKVIASDIKSTRNESVYGYLIYYGGSGEISEYSFKIFTVKGKIAVFNAVDDLRINGSKVVDIDTDLLRRDKDGDIEYDGDKPRRDQLIKYKTNQEGKITEITTPKYGFHDDEFSLTGTSRVSEYKPNVGRIGGYGYDDKTLFMRVPSLDKEENFAMINQADIQQGSSFIIEAFDCNEVNFAKMVVVKTDSASSGEDIDHLEPVSIVKSIGQAYVDDEIVYVLHALQSGKEVTLYSITGDDGAIAIDPKKVFFNTEKTIKDLKRGNIIQYAKDKEGRVDRFKFLFAGIPAAQMDVWENGNDDAGLRNNILFTTVERRTGDYIIVKRADDKEIILDASKAVNVYKYDEAHDSFETTSHYDILPGNTVFVHQNEWNIIDIIIYPDGSLN